jgi:hypothetical protein
VGLIFASAKTAVLIEQLGHRHLHIANRQSVVKLSSKLLEFENAIAPDCKYAESASIGRPLIN